YIIEAANGIQYAQLTAGEKDQSAEMLEEFMENNPDASMADRLRFRKADNMMQSGNYEAAIEEFQQYLDITNDKELGLDAHFNMANAYEQTSQTDKAVEEYRKIVSEFPDAERATASLASLGLIAALRSNHQQAYNYYNKLLEQGC